MKLTLPNLTVIDRAVPYAYTYVNIPIPKRDAPRVPNAARLDPLQLRGYMAGASGALDSVAGPADDQARGELLEILQVDVGSRFILRPGDPSPFVWRDVGTVDCGLLSGMAAVYCAVMARR